VGNPNCSINDDTCSNAKGWLGFCRSHYNRDRVHGDPTTHIRKVVDYTWQKAWKLTDRKPCSGECGEVKLLTEFYTFSRGFLGVTTTCKPCTYKKARKGVFIRKYGPEVIHLMEDISNGAECESCGEYFPGKMYIDHCHTTNRVRGILCEGCNTALGMLRDDVKVILALAEYLMRTDKRT
jgi:hypothetical protein